MSDFMAVVLVVSGALAVLSGTALLTVAAVEAITALRPRPATTEAVAVDANGVAKVLEMLSKVPQYFSSSTCRQPPVLACHAHLGRPIVVAVLALESPAGTNSSGTKS
jgi:hypothetical protein